MRRFITPDDRTLQLKEFQSRLATIEETCAVESVVIPDDLSELGDQLLSPPFGDAFVPAVVAGQGRLLLCEDMMMRQWADRAFGTKGVWLQAVLLSALQAEILELSDYSEALVQLAAHRHGHVPVSVPVLLSVFEGDTSRELVKLRALCTYVGAANAEPVSHIECVAGFLNSIWADGSPTDLRVETATDIVLHALLARAGGEVGAERAQALAEKLNEAPRTYFANRLENGSIWPPDADFGISGSVGEPGGTP